MSKTKDYHYKACGLDYVYLRGGVTRKATSQGQGIAITEARELHKVIAKHVVTSPHSICGQEVRFLRSMLQLSQTGLAKIMGVVRSSVARWESQPHDPIPVPPANSLRLFYAAHSDGDKATRQVVEMLQEQDELDHGKTKVTMDFEEGWRRAA